MRFWQSIWQLPFDKFHSLSKTSHEAIKVQIIGNTYRISYVTKYRQIYCGLKLVSGKMANLFGHLYNLCKRLNQTGPFIPYIYIFYVFTCSAMSTINKKSQDIIQFPLRAYKHIDLYTSNALCIKCAANDGLKFISTLAVFVFTPLSFASFIFITSSSDKHGNKCESKQEKT